MDPHRQLCQCEHREHFDAPTPPGAENGYAQDRHHSYGRTFASAAVRTPYGTFACCAACVAAGHLVPAGA